MSAPDLYNSGNLYDTLYFKAFGQPCTSKSQREFTVYGECSSVPGAIVFKFIPMNSLYIEISGRICTKVGIYGSRAERDGDPLPIEVVMELFARLCKWLAEPNTSGHPYPFRGSFDWILEFFGISVVDEYKVGGTTIPNAAAMREMQEKKLYQIILDSLEKTGTAKVETPKWMTPAMKNEFASKFRGLGYQVDTTYSINIAL